MALKPLKDRVVAVVEKPLEKTKSGILLGEAKEKPAYAVVESVGPEVKSVKKGDKIYTATELCELSHLCGAKTLAVYDSDFYKGMPALTVNDYGDGKAYYIAAKMEQSFLNELYEELVNKCGVSRAMNVKFPYAMTASKRIGDSKDYIFLQNYNDKPGELELDREYFDIVDGKTVSGKISMNPFDIKIFSIEK